MNGRREKTGYALKRERGTVPFQYDKHSKSYADGAWKNWQYPGGYENNPQQARADREFLKAARQGGFNG